MPFCPHAPNLIHFLLLPQGPEFTCTDKAREASINHFFIVREDKGAPGLHLQAVLLARHPALAFLLGHTEVF